VCRFYFLGDDDMLEILGQASNPTVIQSHLKKLYAGIHSVSFASGNSAITHMNSVHGESVQLPKQVAVSDTIEAWLAQVTEQMRAALQAELQAAQQRDADDRWAAQPSQVMGLSQELEFTMVRPVLEA
jgi:dynein heavy chain 2, cytosolic